MNESKAVLCAFGFPSPFVLFVTHSLSLACLHSLCSYIYHLYDDTLLYSLPGSLQRQRRRNVLHACTGLTILSFFMTFLSFDFFATVLGLTIVILFTCSSCWIKHPTTNVLQQQQPTSTALLTSSLLSFICSGVMFWSVMIIALTKVCDPDYHNNNNDDDDDTTANNTTDTTNNTTLAPQAGATNNQTTTDSTPHDEEDYEFFCNNKQWILAFSVLSAVSWLINATLLLWLSYTVPPPPPLPTRRRPRPVMLDEDGDTVAETVVDENDDYIQQQEEEEAAAAAAATERRGNSGRVNEMN